MPKGDKWGQPIIEEALICQDNEKCYQYRRNQTDIHTHIHTYLLN